MPVKNYFPVFHKLKSGAYSYVWTEKCERLLPKHYKDRCLNYMLREPRPVHWKPDTRKYVIDQHGTRLPVQNHPVLVQYPLQSNYGLWAGEGVVQCWSRNVKDSKKYADLMIDRVAKYYVPFLVNRALYSEILDKWFHIPCTNRAMDQIDQAFGLDYYILQNHERDLNSKLAMDLKRKMLLQLCEDANSILGKDRQKVFNRYKEFLIPRKEAEWVGLSIKEALEKAEGVIEAKPVPPLKFLIKEQFLKQLKEYDEAEKAVEHGDDGSEPGMENMTQQLNTNKEDSKGWFSSFRRGKSS